MELLGLLKNKSYFSVGVGSRCTMNSDTFCHIGPGNSHFDLSDAAAKAAAFMGAERDNLLSRKIIAFQEGKNSHRRQSPPAWIAENDGIVLVHILYLCGEFRTSLVAEFLLGLLNFLRGGNRKR